MGPGQEGPIGGQMGVTDAQVADLKESAQLRCPVNPERLESLLFRGRRPGQLQESRIKGVFEETRITDRKTFHRTPVLMTLDR
jgi:hypothetical protein